MSIRAKNTQGQVFEKILKKKHVMTLLNGIRQNQRVNNHIIS